MRRDRHRLRAARRKTCLEWNSAAERLVEQLRRENPQLVMVRVRRRVGLSAQRRTKLVYVSNGVESGHRRRRNNSIQKPETGGGEE